MKKLIINGKETGSVKDYNQDRKSQVWIFNMEDGRTVAVPFRIMKRFSNDKDFNLDITTLENWR